MIAVTGRAPKPSGIGEWRLLYRIDEAALLLGVSAQQIRNMIDDGRLDARQISSAADPVRRHVRVTRESLLRFCGGAS